MRKAIRRSKKRLKAKNMMLKPVRSLKSKYKRLPLEKRMLVNLGGIGLIGGLLCEPWEHMMTCSHRFQKNESPPLHVAHVNVRKPVITPVCCCTHASTNTALPAWTALTHDCALMLTSPVCSFSETHRGTPCLLSGEPGQKEVLITIYFHVKIISIIFYWFVIDIILKNYRIIMIVPTGFSA